MSDTVLIEETPHYRVYQSQYEGTIQVFRSWNNGLVEVKFTDDFCRANGFKSIADAIRRQPNLKHQIALIGRVPEWIAIVNGEFCVPIANLN